MNERITNS